MHVDPDTRANVVAFPYPHRNRPGTGVLWLTSKQYALLIEALCERHPELSEAFTVCPLQPVKLDRVDASRLVRLWIIAQKLRFDRDGYGLICTIRDALGPKFAGPLEHAAYIIAWRAAGLPDQSHDDPTKIINEVIERAAR